jgi:hypothetical protein
LALRSPCDTWRTPSANTNKGRANWLAKAAANSSAPNTAKINVSVSVPMYILRKPTRAK